MLAIITLPAVGSSFGKPKTLAEAKLLLEQPDPYDSRMQDSLIPLTASVVAMRGDYFAYMSLY